MWFMRSINISTDVPNSREDVYAFLDVLGNHEHFTDHMMRNWRLDGPARGVGAKATVDVVLAGRTETIAVEVIEAEAPARNVERNIGSNGRRVATGTYTLDELPDGGTRIQFQYAWQEIPLSERLAAPIIRRVMRRGLQTAMDRLAEQLPAPQAVGVSAVS
jgi:hypothetical protein